MTITPTARKEQICSRCRRIIRVGDLLAPNHRQHLVCPAPHRKHQRNRFIWKPGDVELKKEDSS